MSNAGIMDVQLFIDGDMWCALVGVNIQEGVAGFGKTRHAALVDLADNMWPEDKHYTPSPTKERNGR